MEEVTGRDRAARNDEIVTARLRGLGENEVANRFKVSDRQVRRIMAEYRESRSPLVEMDASDIVADTLDAYGAAIEELALLAAETAHDGSKLGAIRARLDVLRLRIELLQSVGVLPRDLGQIRVAEDLDSVARTIVTVFERHGVPPEVQEEIAEIIAEQRPYQG